MFGASESAAKVLNSEAPVVVDSDGRQVSLLMELPDIERELTKANPGALGTVLVKALKDDDPAASDLSPSIFGRRRSSVEMDIRRSVTTDQTVERVSALDSMQASKRGMWNKVRSSRMKQKLAVASAFMQNDDANEKAAKAAISAKLHIVKATEPEVTNTVHALAELYHGELRGLDYKFKTEASLFRKVMARLDASLAEAAVSKERKPPPTPADILDSILDVLRYTAVSTGRTWRPFLVYGLFPEEDTRPCAHSATGVRDKGLYALGAEVLGCTSGAGL